MTISSKSLLNSLPDHPLIVAAVTVAAEPDEKPDNDLKSSLVAFVDQVVSVLTDENFHRRHHLQVLLSKNFKTKMSANDQASFSLAEIRAEAIRVARQVATVAPSARESRETASKPLAQDSFRLSQSKLTSQWKNTNRGYTTSYRRTPVFARDDKIFTIGSCFALEMKAELRRRNFTVTPDYGQLDFDLAHQKFGKLPVWDNINHYNTYSIKAEYERAAHGEQTPEEDVFKIDDNRIHRLFESDAVFENPYRRRLWGSSIDNVLNLSREIDALLADGIRSSQVHIITLGLIEVWRNPVNSKVYIERPHRNSHAPAEPCLTTFQQNLDNLRSVIELIHSFGHDRQVLLSVSPVPLEATFTDDDVVIANQRSKSTLRAVAAEIEQSYSNVHYVPSYEYAAKHDVYEEDGRHVRRDAVKSIIDMTLDSYLSADEACTS